MIAYRYIVLWSVWFLHMAYAQNPDVEVTTITGQVYSVHNEPIIGALVWVGNKTHVTETDLDGNFKIDSLSAGTYLLHIEFAAYKSIDSMVVAGTALKPLILHENSEVHRLDEVVIHEKTVGEKIEETGFQVNSIDLKPLQNLNLDLNRVLNQTTGIRVREEGGLGSDFNFSLNGFASNQVKFFIDGMPMDNYGSSLTLNNIPVNLISRVDIYKGVVPVFLGSDALGGAINVVTNQAMNNYLDVSYSIGSFNTHRASAIARYTHAKSGFTVNTKGIFNYSDNNYWVDIQVGKSGGSLQGYERIRRFHDGYQSQTLELEVGVMRKKYADKLLFGLIASGNHKDIQNGYNLTKVSGAVYTTDRVLIPTFKFAKHDLGLKGLHVNVFANYNFREALSADTGKYIYNWYGRDIVNPYPRSGELNWDKTLFRFNDNSATAVANLKYEINKDHIISINNTFSNYRRQGEDPLSYDIVPFKEPNILTKNISGIAYDAHFFNTKLKTSVFGKSFMMDAKTFREADGDADALKEVQNDYLLRGYGLAVSYMLRPARLLKISYENTARLPDASEMFGNGLLQEANPELRPETSKNFNIGLSSIHSFRKHKVAIELGYLYRLPKDLIRMSLIGVTSKSDNVVSAKISCIEAGIKYDYNKFFFIEFNGTYQNLLNTDKYNKDGSISVLYLDRLPNIPFLFANGSAGVQFANVLIKNSKCSIGWTSNFVNAFYLKWPGQGSAKDKMDIPSQLAHSIYLSYSLKEDRYNVSLACTNITDAQLYDNFRLQKPGRAFSIKLRYFISKS